MAPGSMNIIEDRQKDGQNNEYPPAQPTRLGRTGEVVSAAAQNTGSRSTRTS